MPVSPNNLITVINKNKNKKLIATKIIETNPKVLPVVSKLTQNRELSSSIENDDFKVNRGLLEDLYNRIRTVQQNNTQIIQLFPDIELSIQILVSSILSPKKMTDIQLNYKFNKNITINPSISSKVLETIKTYINDNYELEDKLPEIVREALFTSGAYVQAIIPEASVDDVINTDLLPSYSTEDFKNRVDYIVDSLVKPINLIKVSSTPSTPLTPTTKDKKVLAEHIASEAFIHITDNVNILNFNNIKEKITSNLIRSSFKRNTSISQESMDKVNYIDIFRQKSSSPAKDIEFIKKKDETTRKSLGRPMITRIPTESIIPVFIPGNESEHIGYFVLLDGSGKPLNTELKKESINQLSTTITSTNTTNLTPIQKAYNNLVHDSVKDFNVNELFELYKEVLEKQIYTSIKSSLYGKAGEIASKNDIYFLMFTRALADQKTNLLFIPKDLVVYFAFQYNDIGIGKTLLENLSVLSSMRAILLFSKVMSQAKQAIDVTKVNISLDPNDPDPEKTIEQIQDSVLKLRQNFFPLGMNNPVDLLNWIQRAGLQFSYENNPLIPNVKIDFENTNLSHTVPNSELEEDLRKQSIIALGLSPESVDGGFTPEFATTVVNNNILLSKRITIYQKTLSKHLSKYIDLITYNDEELRGELRLFINESIATIEASLTEEEKQFLNRDKEGFIEHYINQLSQNIEVTLPKPENTNITNLSAEFDLYKENLIKIIDSVVSPEIFSEDISGELSQHIDTIKNVYTHYLLRKWCAENDFFPEVLEITQTNKEEVDELLGNIVTHLTSTSRNSTALLTMLQKFKLAMNTDLNNANVSGDSGDTVTASSSSEESDNNDLVSEDDFNLDI